MQWAELNVNYDLTTIEMTDKIIQYLFNSFKPKYIIMNVQKKT